MRVLVTGGTGFAGRHLTGLHEREGVEARAAGSAERVAHRRGLA